MILHEHSVLVLSVAWCLATLACLPQFLPGLLALIATMIGESALKKLFFLFFRAYSNIACRSYDHNIDKDDTLDGCQIQIFWDNIL